MPINIQHKGKGLMVLEISGQLQPSDKELWEKEGRKAIEQFKKIRLLVKMSDFEGWAKSIVWGDMGFMLTYGEQIEKMALVGDPRWKDELFSFTGKDFRTTQVEFFESSRETEALGWLK